MQNKFLYKDSFSKFIVKGELIQLENMALVLSECSLPAHARRNTMKNTIFLIFFLFSFMLNSESRKKTVLVSSFPISIRKYGEDVRTNLKTAAGRIRHFQIKAGETFSFNKTVGEASLQNGYMPARSFGIGETVLEPGGGICIAATVVYNVLLSGGFEIEERHKHSRRVHYVSPGLDATILYGKKDLRMKNTGTQDFILKLDVDRQYITAKLYSSSNLAERYEMSTDIQEESSAFGTESVSKGLSATVFREKWTGDTMTERKFLYSER
ncbi:MAG TPA: VanW family protein, partial [Leptospiraceae bacterium]|nr:VanW family protein [Leptospiraceae bacterium]